MQDKYYKILLFGFLYFTIFLIVFFALPVNVLAIVFPIVGVLFAWWAYRNNQKKAAYIYLILTALMVWLAIGSIRTLAIQRGLIVGEIITASEWIGFAISAGYYIRFWPVFLIIAILMFVGWIYAVLAKVESVWRITHWIGYCLIIVIIAYNLIVVFFPTEPYEQVIQIAALGLSIGFEAYYTVQIGTWVMAGFTFIFQFLGSIVNSTVSSG